MRYQQVYDASQFSQAPNGGWITEIDFRVDSIAGYPFSATLRNLQINLSTTAKVPDGLSPIFGANIGSDDTLVFGPGQLAMSSAFDGAPQAFDIKITLATPFLYNPTAGNLLLDVKNYEGADGLPRFPPGFDAESITNDAISRIYADSVNAISATQVDTLGLVTQFQMNPIPEPSPVTLLLLGGASLGLLVHRRKLGKSGQHGNR
jgi:hypothetical protein